MKKVYKYNADTFVLESYQLVFDSDYQLQDNETTIEPTDGLLSPIKFDKDNKTWLSATKDENAEWIKTLKEDTTVNISSPTSQQKVNASLLLQIAALNAKINRMKEGNS